MKVFISWSGTKSRLVAAALHGWIPDVVNRVEPFMSETDIEKGAVGIRAIGEQLDDSFFGIVCLTQANMTRPWLNYEAGALSKSVGGNLGRVATLLIDIENAGSVIGPLGSFQATKMRDLSDFKSLIRTMARAAGDTRSDEKLDQVVDKLWPDLRDQIEAAGLSKIDEGATTPTPGVETKVDEILEILRQPRSSPTPDVEVIARSESGMAWARKASPEQVQDHKVQNALKIRLIDLLPSLDLHTDSVNVAVDESDVYLDFRDPVNVNQYGSILSALGSLIGNRSIRLIRPPNIARSQ